MLRNGNIVIKGEKHDEKEEKAADYYLQERRFGAFERSFAKPETVAASKVDATFKNGVLKVTLPKTAAAQKPSKKVEIKAARQRRSPDMSPGDQLPNGLLLSLCRVGEHQLDNSRL